MPPEKNSPLSLFRHAWEVLCEHWLKLTLASILTLLLPALVFVALLLPSANACAAQKNVSMECFSPERVFMVSGMYMALLGFLGCGLVRMSQEALDNQTPSWPSLFQLQAGLKAALAFVLAALPVWFFMSGFGVFGNVEAWGPWTGPLLVLGLVVGVAACIALLPCVFLLQAFAQEPDMGLGEALAWCMETGKGKRLKILLVLAAAGLVQQLASFCCLLSFPAFVFFVLCQTALWKSLQDTP